MRYLTAILFVGMATVAPGQTIVGTWQLTEEKPCLEQQMELTDTEKELLPGFGPSGNAVARTIRFGPKGKGEEGIFEAGKKKGTDKAPFRYQLSGGELQFLDKKSGIIKERFVVDELTPVKLRFHRVGRDCGMRTFSKIK